MRLRAFFTAVVFALAPVAANAERVDWRHYTIPETGVNVDMPVTIFAEDGGKPDAGYGRRFLTSDGRANLTIQSLPNEAGDSPARFLVYGAATLLTLVTCWGRIAGGFHFYTDIAAGSGTYAPTVYCPTSP